MIDARVRKRGPNGFELDAHWKTDANSVVLVGPAGAGKTLLLESLCGFARPDEGRIALDGDVVFDGAGRVFAPPERRRAAYIPSRGALLAHLTVRDNLALAVRSVGRLERRRKVDVMLDEAALTPLAGELPVALTEGQRLRASVARALLAEPKVLVIDEPERCVDEELLDELRAAVDVATGARHVRVVLAGRNAEALLEIAGEACVMDAGKIVRHGSPEDVLDEPLTPAVARILGRHSVIDAEILAIDPARKLSRLRCHPESERGFEIIAPYFPGLMKGARVQVALRVDRVTATARGDEGIPRVLDRFVEGVRAVALHLEGGLIAELSRREWEPYRHTKNWMLSIPPEAVRLLRQGS